MIDKIKLKRIIFTLLLIITIEPTFCFSSVDYTKIKDFQIPAILKTKKIGIVDFLPLPKNYPIGFKPIEFSLSKELYSDEEDRIRTFVPRNSISMIVELTMLALIEKGVSIDKYANIDDAFSAGADIVIAGAVKECKVSTDVQDENSLKAEASVHLSVFNLKKSDNILLEGDITEVAFLRSGKETASGDTDFQLIRSNLLKTNSDIFTISEEECFHPLRVLLSVAIYNSVSQIIEKMTQSESVSQTLR